MTKAQFVPVLSIIRGFNAIPVVIAQSVYSVNPLYFRCNVAESNSKFFTSHLEVNAFTTIFSGQQPLFHSLTFEQVGKTR